MRRDRPWAVSTAINQTFACASAASVYPIVARGCAGQMGAGRVVAIAPPMSGAEMEPACKPLKWSVVLTIAQPFPGPRGKAEMPEVAEAVMCAE